VDAQARDHRGGRASLVRPTWRAERARPGWEGVDNTGAAPVIGLPGYPLATAVVFELFAMPLLAALRGHAGQGLGRGYA
jgi:molybdopterin biosynthesis enzyme